MQRGKKKKLIVPAGILIVVMGFLLSLTGDTGPQKPGSPLTRTQSKERLNLLVAQVIDTHDIEPQKALEYGQQALDLLRTFPDQQQRSGILAHLCTAAALRGEFPRAKAYGEKSLAIAREIGNKTREADALANLGDMYWHQGNYREARIYFIDALKLSKEIKNKSGVAKSLYLMGSYYWKISEYSRALEYILEAKRIFEELGDKKGKADSHNMMGIINSEMGEYREAFRHFSEAHLQFKSPGNSRGLSKALNNMGFTLSQLGDNARALEYLMSADEINRKLGIQHYIANTLNNIGEVYTAMKNHPLALDYYTQSLKIKESIDDQRGIAYTLVNIGRSHRDLGHEKEAIQYLERALSIAHRINARSEIKKAYQELSEICEDLGQYRESLDYHKKYKEMNDAIFNQQSSDKIAHLKTEYELDENEKETALLKKDREIKQLSLEHQGNQIKLFIVAFVLMGILVGIIYRRSRQISALMRDLTDEIRERQKTTEMLRQSEENFRTLAEKSVVGIYITRDNAIQYVNPRFLTVFGYTREEILGRDPLQLVVEEDRSMVRENLRRWVEDPGEVLFYEFRGLTKERKTIYLESYGAHTHYQGEPAVLETIIEVTGRKRAEAELLKGQKLESIGLLASGIAHDFNNILAVIIGNLSMALEECEDLPQVFKNLKAAEKATTQASELSEKLVTLARGGVGIPQPLPLKDVLIQILDFYPEMNNIIGTVSIPPDLKPLYADERQMRQVMYNLLQNAGEAMTDPAKPKSVAITAENITFDMDNDFGLLPGDYLEVTVKDNGKGIPPRHLLKVFDPYFTTKDTLNQKGMGLGLAICYSIIRKHNGHIAIESEVGKGTAVKLYIPAYNRDDGLDSPSLTNNG